MLDLYFSIKNLLNYIIILYNVYLTTSGLSIEIKFRLEFGFFSNFWIQIFSQFLDSNFFGFKLFLILLHFFKKFNSNIFQISGFDFFIFYIRIFSKNSDYNSNPKIFLDFFDFWFESTFLLLCTMLLNLKSVSEIKITRIITCKVDINNESMTSIVYNFTLFTAII